MVGDIAYFTNTEGRLSLPKILKLLDDSEQEVHNRFRILGSDQAGIDLQREIALKVTRSLSEID